MLTPRQSTICKHQPLSESRRLSVRGTIDGSISDPFQARSQARIDTLLIGERFMDIRVILQFDCLASPGLAYLGETR